MSNIQKWKATEPYLDLHGGLLEAPYWEVEQNRLRFVDIKKKQIHIVDLSKGPSSHQLLKQLDIPVGVTADVEGTSEEFVIGGKTGYALFNRNTGKYRYIKEIWGDEKDPEQKADRMRSNDGAVDSRGRFWMGTMNDFHVENGPTNEGVVFRLDPDMTLHRMIEGATITNGIGWSMDDKMMYWTDSPTKTIWQFDYDAESGEISNRRPFFKIEDEEGVPDGFAIDREGNIWTAVYGMARVLRISPQGKLTGQIDLPARCVSCPCFAGEELFITTAEEEDPDKCQEYAKYAGGLFKVHVGITGQPYTKFKHQG